MKIELNNLVSITEANQNFSKVAQMVYEKVDANDMLVEEAAAEYLTKHSKAFKELAK